MKLLAWHINVEERPLCLKLSARRSLTILSKAPEMFIANIVDISRKFIETRVLLSSADSVELSFLAPIYSHGNSSCFSASCWSL